MKSNLRSTVAPMLILAGLMLWFVPARAAESISVLLQKAIFAEETEGNLDAAIKIYEGITREIDTNRGLVAQAQYRLGVCQLKRGKKDEAGSAFRKLLERFSDQTDLAGKARERLSELGLSPASPVVRQVWAASGSFAPGTVSSDGRYLSLLDWQTGDVGVRNLITGENRWLTDMKSRKKSWERCEYVTRMSRDGKQIAYTWLNHDGFYDLRVVSVDDPKPRVVFKESSEWCWPADWSPEGKAFAAVIQDKKTKEYVIALIQAEDGSMEKIKSLGFRSPFTVCFAPDGGSLAYSCVPDTHTPENDIFVLSLVDRHERPVVEHPSEDRLIQWSPDGRSLLFISDRRGSFDVWSAPVSEERVKHEPMLLKPDVGELHPIGISRDGSLFYGNSLRSDDLYAASVDFDSGKLAARPEKVRTRFHGPTAAFRVPSNGYELSPDGRLLATLRYRGERKILYVVNLTTGEDKEFGNLPPSEWHNAPFWSPDNRNLLFRVMGIDGRVHLYLFDCVAGQTRTIATDEAGSRIEYLGGYSAEKNAVFYVRRDVAGKKFMLVRYDLDGRVETAQKIQHAANPEATYRFALSPDHKFLFYVRTLRPESGQNSSVAVRYNLQTGDESVLMRSPNDIEVRVHTSQVAIKTTDENDRRFLHFVDFITQPPRERLVVPLPRYSHLGWWTLGGRYLLVESLIPQPPDYQTGLWTISTEDGTLRKTDLTVRAMHVAGVRGDGKQLYFHTANHGSNEVWVMENLLPQVPPAKK